MLAHELPDLISIPQAQEEFGLSRLLRLQTQEIEGRFQEFKSMTHFDV